MCTGRKAADGRRTALARWTGTTAALITIFALTLGAWPAWSQATGGAGGAGVDDTGGNGGGPNQPGASDTGGPVPGGVAGTAPSGNGGNGEGLTFGAAAGSGGGGGADGASGSTTGGNGGNGGTSGCTASACANSTGGGGGGAGGTGINISSSFPNSGTVQGGNGGVGGAGGPGIVGFGNNAANGGGGGGGGFGIIATTNGLTITNNAGASIIGGNGGAGGAGSTGDANQTGTAGTAGAGGVGINGAGLTVIDAGTISGGLSGDGVTRANAITFTAGTNSLQLRPGYNIVGNVVGTGSDAFQLGGSGGSNFNLSSFGSAQQYRGFATFSVIGGNWTLTGANTTPVPFSVSNATATVNGTFNDTSATVNAGGILVVNGTLSDPTINSGGVLSGTGSVGATTINSGGTLAPGPVGGIGTLTINGSLAFTSGALYAVNLNPATSSSTMVTGTASLAGTVQANFASGSYVSKQYPILTATGGLGGTTFSGVTNVNLPAGATDSLSYTANGVFLNLTAPFAVFTGLNTNQQNVANALTNFFNTTGGIPAQFFGVTPGGLSQLDGEAGTGAERAVFQLTNEFLTLMLDPFVNGRGNVGGGGPALGFAPEQRDNLPPDIALAYASILTKAPPQSFEQRWTAWGSAYGGANNANGDPAAGSNNVRASTFGFAGGMDYHVTPYTVVGFALAGAGTNWGLANAMGGGRSDALQAGAYGISWLGPAYIAGALSVSNHWFTTNRSALGDAITASFVGQGYGARLEGGYRYAVLPAFAVTPYGAVQFQDFNTPAFSETDTTGGGLGLNVAAQNSTDVRTELGARFDDPTVIYNKPLILFGRLAWAHDFVSNPTLSAAFEALPGGTFTVNGAPMPRDSALTTAGAQLFLTPQWTLLAKFEGEFAPGSQTYAGTGTLRYSW
jgi:uncharacterized protein with beta-barrel porin domain